MVLEQKISENLSQQRLVIAQFNDRLITIS